MSRRALMTEAAKRGKYSNLFNYLDAFNDAEWHTSFSELEQILEFELPKSARLYRPWWANDNSSGHSQAMSWTMAGWKTSGIDMDEETIVFRKVGDDVTTKAIVNRSSEDRNLNTPPTMEDFRRELRAQFIFTKQKGDKSIKLNAGELHRAVGGYPKPFNRMTMCCTSMYDEMRGGDKIISAPPKGKGASLTIEYKLPR